LKNVIRGILSRPSLQPALLGLLKLCHAGLNYGGGQSVGISGEIGALEFLKARRQDATSFVLFDVGANDGEYLNAALSIMGADLKAYSFEPQSASFQKLRTRLGSDPRVTLKQTALGSEVGSAELFFDRQGAVGASLHRISNQALSEMVSQSTVDQVCEMEHVAQIDLLKIDTEGHEMAVLEGASSMIESDRIAAIQFEFGETFLRTRYHFAAPWEMLSARYTIYRILRHGLAEISRYSPDLEIYKLANFLCVRRS